MNAKSRKLALLLPLLGGFVLLAGLLVLLAASPAAADVTIRYVAPGGDCGGASPCYATLQAAVDAAASGDEIRVAQGTYTGVQTSGTLSQLVYAHKSLTFRGGFTTGDWNTPDPATNMTTLDAEGDGRVFLIVGEGVDVVIEGFTITGGDASGQGGAGVDNGGGVYAFQASLTLRNNVIQGNRASHLSLGAGGGVCLYQSDAILTGNTVYSNTASTADVGWGGGIFSAQNELTLSGNQIRGNVASSRGQGQGGGVYLNENDATLTGNTIEDNIASITDEGFQNNGHGGGVYGDTNSTVTMSGNIVRHNIAVAGEQGYLGSGGGLYFEDSSVTLTDNTIEGNTACRGGNLWASGDGGGIHLDACTATLSGNTIISNTAAVDRDGNGGGIRISGSDITLTGNTIRGNVGGQGANAGGSGGGVRVRESTAVITGNVIAENIAATSGWGSGGGLSLINSTVLVQSNHVQSNTASSTGTGQGGGIELANNTRATVNQNYVAHNVASGNADGKGGGISSSYDEMLTLNDNVVVSNTATLSATATGEGGGVWVEASKPFALNNDIVGDNHANTEGSGLWFRGLSSQKQGLGTLLHTTIANNKGDGAGIYVDDYMTLWFTNTIIANHAGAGLSVNSQSTVNLESTLWHGNGSHWSGAGTVTSTHDYAGDPAFVAPADDDFHLSAGSAAHDKGVATDLDHDVDGELRSVGMAPDLGADEYADVGLDIAIEPQTSALNRGQSYTKHILITAVGVQNATNVTVSETFDVWQQPLSASASTGSCAIATGGYGGRVECTVGTVSPGERVTVTIEKQVSPTAPLGQKMTDVITATANETSNESRDSDYVQDCHVRINNDTTEYLTVQDAVEAASAGDVVKVAGTCVGADVGDFDRQQVYLDKDLTVRGGYAVDNWTSSDPAANPTTLDALGLGRVFYVAKNATVAIEGLTITGGDAATSGGGLLASGANVTLRHNTIVSNTATYGGGGVVVSNGNGPTRTSSTGYAVLEDNQVISNTAKEGSGGGAFLVAAQITLRGNTFRANRATNSTVSSQGGGVYLAQFTTADVVSNQFIANESGLYGGGGLIMNFAEAANLDGNLVIENNASKGSGVYLRDVNSVTATNNIIADNPGAYGGGVYIEGSTVKMRHNTLARNGSVNDIYVTRSDFSASSVAITNTIVVSHVTGIYVDAWDNQVTMEGTLWGAGAWANGTDWEVDNNSTLVAGTVNLWQAPVFVDADNGDYHLMPASPGVDQGVTASVTEDIDQQPRPNGGVSDIGADEVWSCTAVTGVAINGPDTGQTNRHLTLTAVAQPGDVTPNVSYRWWPAPDSGQGTATATYTFGYAGEHGIYVIAANCGGSATDSHLVTIEQGQGFDIYLPLVRR